MLRNLRDTLQPVLGDVASWDRLSGRVSSLSVAPGAGVRAVGEPVTDVLVVEHGLFEVAAQGEPVRWATPGSIIGLAASLSGALSPVAVTALRHGRIWRFPADALWDHDGDVRASVATVARLAQLPDFGLATLPPDPLIVTVLLEGCDEALASAITAGLETAVRAMNGSRLVRLSTTPASNVKELAEELSAHESGTRTCVYVVHGDEGARAAELVTHADRVIIFQPLDFESAGSVAHRVACDGSPRRHTELVLAGGVQDAGIKATRPQRRSATVKRIHLLPAPSPTRLELLLTELRQNAREQESLREYDVLAGLSGPELASIQDRLRWERIDGGSVLLRQGELADDAWLLRAGRLEVVRTTSAGDRHVAWLGPGAFVGEAALLTGGQRVASVHAVRDSTVARLDQQTIEMLLDSVGFTRAVARSLATRASGDTGSDLRRARTFAIVPLAGAQRVRAFIAELTAVCEEADLDATVVDAERLNSALGQEASSVRRGDIGDADIIAWLDRLERRHDVVMLVCENTVDSWTRRAIRQGDHILLVVDASTTPERRPIERELLGGDGPEFIGARHLVLLQPAGISEALGTGRWLAERPHHTHHHVRAGDRGDLARLARRLTGRAVALVLSGASSRAPAHFGVVRAMDELGLPIDITSGSSSGAGIAALLAAGLRAEDGLASALEILRTGTPRVRQFQPPITALTSGAAADRSLQAVFGDRQLEDQLIPAVLTAVDIRRHRAVHLTRGPMWKLVRASGSLPLLWPPVWHEGDLLVDGGIIDYLPTEVFGDQVDGGLVIASNLDATAGQGAPAFEGALEYGTVLNSWRELGRRLWRSSAARPPGLVDILFHTMGIPSFQQQEGLAALATRGNVCMLTPPLASFGLFDVTADIGRALEAATWEHARLELNGIAALWHSRREWRAVTSSAS